MLELVENEDHYRKVVEEIIIKARYRLDIVTAPLKALVIPHGRKSQSICNLFKKNCKNGTSIRILHSSVPSEYFIKTAYKNDLNKAENFAMRRCPRVHQKSILADGKLLYLGSANLTGAGIGAKSESRRNFELGIITDDSELIDRVDSLFELIWSGDMCLSCNRKKSCPIPLEELK